MLRPTPGDPWGVEQHHWYTGAEENQQLNPGGTSNRQKSSGPNQLKYIALCRGHNLDNNNGPGTNWVCYVDSFYFDLFGLPSPKKYSFIKRYNTLQYQKRISVLCGYFCLLFIKTFQDCNSINVILYKFLDPINPSKNETILKDYFMNSGNV